METTSKVKLHVFVNRVKVEFHTDNITGGQLLTEAGFDSQNYELFHLKGEGDPTGGVLIPNDQVITLKNGEHFRAIPGNRTFGAY